MNNSPTYTGLLFMLRKNYYSGEAVLLIPTNEISPPINKAIAIAISPL
jgi:hypothetical protein